MPACVMVVFGRVEVLIHPFLNSAVYGGKRSDSRSGHFTKTKHLPLLTIPEARVGGYRSGLDLLVKGESCPCPRRGGGGGLGVKLHSFLTSALDKNWPVSCTGSFCTAGKYPGTEAGWSPGSVWASGEDSDISLCRNSNPGLSSP